MKERGVGVSCRGCFWCCPACFWCCFFCVTPVFPVLLLLVRPPPVYSLLRVAASDVAPDFSRTRNGTILTVLGMASSVCLPQNFIKGLGKSGQLSMRTLQEGFLYVAFTLCSPQIHISHLLLQLGESVQRFLQGMVPARKKIKKERKEKKKRKRKRLGLASSRFGLGLVGGSRVFAPLGISPSSSFPVSEVFASGVGNSFDVAPVCGMAASDVAPVYVVATLLMFPLFLVWPLFMAMLYLKQE